MPIAATTGISSTPLGKVNPDTVRTGEGGGVPPVTAVAGAKGLPLPDAGAARLIPGQALSQENMAQLVSVYGAAVLPNAPKATSTPQQMLEQTIKRLAAATPEAAELASGKALTNQTEEILRATVNNHKGAAGDGSSPGPDTGRPAPEQPAPTAAAILLGQLTSGRVTVESSGVPAADLSKQLPHAATEREPLRLTAFPLALMPGKWPIRGVGFLLLAIGMLGLLYFG